MGKFIWHDWARFVSISASIYLIWASIWGILYRKFFWDFIDHGFTNTTPPIPTPNPRYHFIVSIIVTIPLIQIIAMVMAIFALAFEYPAPFLKGTFAERNFTFKGVFLVFQAVFAILFYQGTNAAIYSTIAAIGYARAVSLGEKMEVPKPARGARGAGRA